MPKPTDSKISHDAVAKLPQSPMGCAMDRLLRLLTGQWTCYLLWQMHIHGPMRFGALKRSMQGLSSKVLTERLRMLEDANIIFRDHVPTIPPQVTYGLTERGVELMGTFEQLSVIAKRWCEQDKEQKEAALDMAVEEVLAEQESA